MSEQLTRCRAGSTCAEGENVYDPDTRGRIDRLGKVIYTPGLCPACTRGVGYTLSSLAGAYGELSELLEPATTIKLNDPDMPDQPHITAASSMPLRGDVLDLQMSIDHEVTVWAEAVADKAGLSWDSQDMARTRDHFRVQKACPLLKANLEVLLALPAQEYRARGVDREGVWDPDTGDTWVVRDGVAAALWLVELDRRATTLAGRHPGDKIATPCKNCHRRALYREHHLNEIHCRVCHTEYTDDEHDDFMAGLYKAYGIEGR